MGVTKIDTDKVPFVVCRDGKSFGNELAFYERKEEILAENPVLILEFENIREVRDWLSLQLQMVMTIMGSIKECPRCHHCKHYGKCGFCFCTQW